MKMWAGRFREPLDADFERWQRSFPFDRRLLPEELEASRAYARALGRAGVLANNELAAILDGLGQIEGRAASDPGWTDCKAAEDVHHFVELRLVELVGEAGAKLHTGRSRNEQISTDLRLFTRKSLDRLRAGLAALIEVFLARADELRGVAMPAYTHLQRAEPVLASHWLLAYCEMFFRDADRLADCRRRVDVLPLGSGAVAGAGWALDRQAMARELGFARISLNSLDAAGDRDFVLEFLQVAAALGLHLSRWAEEGILFATTEFGFIRLPEAFSTGSSAMPQKKNPDAWELLRAKAARLAANEHAVAALLKGLPPAYNKDLQETQEPLFDSADTAEQCLALASPLARALEFHREKMAAAAVTGFLNARTAADYLVRRGVPFRRAHALIGQVVMHCLDTGKELADLALEDLRRFSPDFAPGFHDSITLEATLARHDLPGGTAPARVEQALREAQERLAALREATHARA